MEDLKLHGFWYSPFTLRVKWTLKLKGIPYENIEEDRYNMSAQLVEYNPVYKRTPVIVHNVSVIWPLALITNDEEKKKGIKKIWEQFRVVEDQKKYFGGDNINIVDIAFGSIVKFLEVIEDALQLKCLEEEKFPRLHSWYKNFKNDPVINENLPDQQKMVSFLNVFREKLLASS